MPDDVPEVVKLALGDRINRPINVEIAMSWVLASGSTALIPTLAKPPSSATNGLVRAYPRDLPGT